MTQMAIAVSFPVVPNPTAQAAIVAIAAPPPALPIRPASSNLSLSPTPPGTR